MIKKLHLITPYIPFPADFGGAIDVFYRIVALKELGVRIHLHCFEYNRGQSKELEGYCEKVYYYKRGVLWKKFFSKVPYIVNSRNTDALTKRLNENPFPILYDGLHSSFTLNTAAISQKKYFRPHNVEADYFLYLAKAETNVLRRALLYVEYFKILRYEKHVSSAEAIFAITINDQKHFSSFSKTYLVRAFHSNTTIQSKTGKGKYALYHGNLTIPENIKALRFLLDEVFSKIDYPLTVAGKITSEKLSRKIKSHSNITLVENPSQRIMNDLIQNAQLVLLPTFQETGIKLKLLESLFKGRHCIANNAMIDNTELESYCVKANAPNEWIEMIQKYKDFHFSSEDIEKRRSIMSLFNNVNEAKKIIDKIFTA